MRRLLLLLPLLAACGAASSAEPGPRTTEYGGTYSPVADQCSLPVEERSEGWFCYEPR